jgi:diguanylate cyclase (GGDEF)-like protein
MRIKGKPWEFFENLNEIVYVADIEKYEIVYMNRIAREHYNIATKDGYYGKKCYELLQGNLKPCSFCNNRLLKIGAFEEWSYVNPIVGRKFMLKDTVVEDEGRLYRMEIAVDLSTPEYKKKLDDGNADYEAMINEGLRISLMSSVPDKSINSLIEYIGKVLKSDRMYIFEEQRGNCFSNTYEWCAMGVTPQKDNLQNIPKEDAEMWMECFRNNRNVVIKDIEALAESDPVMYDYLKPQDIKSLVVSPLIYNNKILGFYGVDNPTSINLENISTLFMIMGHFITVQLKRSYLDQKLRQLSLYDQLTGFGNRHAVDAYMDNIDVKKSLGIVYCDIMGLKRTNDQYGHKAGDELIIRACECLNLVFYDYSIFRMGGDEFLVLCSGIEEGELALRVERLKIEMRARTALMGIGSEWHPNGRESLDELLVSVDAKMYEDKRRYYEQKNGGGLP